MTRLVPYGSADQTDNLSKVGKSKTPRSLAARMPSLEVVAKVGKLRTPRPLAARMPSLEVAAKVGENIAPVRRRAVVRRKARG